MFKKIILHFRRAKNEKMGFFCEAGTKNMAQNATTPIFKQSIPYLPDNARVF